MSSAYGKAAETFRSHGIQMEQSMEKLEQSIQNQTQQERKEVEEAMTKLRQKIHTITQQEEFQKESERLKTHAQQRQEAMKSLLDLFWKERQQIEKDPSLTWKQRQDRIEDMFHYFQNNCLTEKEKLFFQQATHHFPFYLL